MKLELVRIYNCDRYCIGKLYIDGAYFCDTIEDTDRMLTCEMSEAEILKIKVNGTTAIPTGTYNINMTYSPKFAGRKWAKKYNNLVPLLENIKCWSGVRIHPSNKAEDVEGCIAPGQNKIKGQVINSIITYYNLMDNYIMKAYNKKEKISITITRKF